jgi:F0F1-type ATP synthase assembly protein I
MKKKSPKSKKNPLPKVDKKAAKNQFLTEDENQLLELSPLNESASRANVNSRFSDGEDEENLLEIPEFIPTAPNISEKTKSADEIPNLEASNGTVASEPAADFESRFEAVESQIAAEEVVENKFAAQVEDRDVRELQPEAELENVEALQPETEIEHIEEIQPRLQTTEEIDEVRPEAQIAETLENQSEVQEINDVQPETRAETEFQTPVAPESVGETARKSGLAYGAALTLFGSVIVMLVLGYFADRIFGSSPWGIIIGIVLGAAIGFYQFFRISSQIFKNKS